MTKIVVTGGTGFVGSNLVNSLSHKKENDIFVIDNFSTGVRENIIESDSVRYFEADIRDKTSLAKIFSEVQPDFVFHFAAVVGVERTLNNPFEVFSDLEGTKNVLDACVDFKIKRIYYSSSSEVYGEPVEIPQKESSPINASLPYAAVKYMSELFCKSYFEKYGLEYTIFRFFNTFGANQSKDFVVPTFVMQALNNEPITIIGDGKQSRTFCFVEETIGLCLECFYSSKFVCDVINIGSDQEYNMLELAELIIELSNSKSEIKFLKSRKEGDVRTRCPDLTKRRTLSFKSINIKHGIQQMLNSIKS